MKKRFTIFLAITLFITLCGLALRPVPVLPEEKLHIVEGFVEQISEGSSEDIVFKLHDSQNRYYINRGLEQGLDLADLRARLIGRKVTIKYPQYWSLMSGGSTHLSKLEHNGQTVFSELTNH